MQTLAASAFGRWAGTIIAEYCPSKTRACDHCWAWRYAARRAPNLQLYGEHSSWSNIAKRSFGMRFLD